MVPLLSTSCQANSRSEIGTLRHIGEGQSEGLSSTAEAGAERSVARADGGNQPFFADGGRLGGSPGGVSNTEDVDKLEAARVALAEQRDTRELMAEWEYTVDDCPALDLLIDMSSNEEYISDRGVLVKVLQAPAFSDDNRTPAGELEPVPAEQWDRSEFPAGACVVRLRGVAAACYTNATSIALYHPPGDAGSGISQGSFHARRKGATIDLCQWREPGCPRSEWGSYSGYWWYLSQRADDSLLVACASSCEGFFRAPISLELRAESGPGICGKNEP